jgi:serine/threonine protein kinase
MTPSRKPSMGPYELLAPIGSGGMGEVFRGRDKRLNRDVAIKVLPKEFASDPERLRRFEQESKTLAAFGLAKLVENQKFAGDPDTRGVSPAG